MIAEKLKYYRVINRLTQSDVAFSAGMKPSCIGQIEARNTDVKLSTAVKIAKALDVKLEQLIKPLSESERVEMKEANRRMSEIRIDRISASMKRKRALTAY